MLSEEYAGDPRGGRHFSTIDKFARIAEDLNCYRLASITRTFPHTSIVQYNKQGFLYSIQTTYRHRQDGGAVFRSDTIKGDSQDEPCATNTLVLDEAERITLIKGCYTDEAITRLYMMTNEGKYVDFGTNKGEKFCWEMRPAQYFFGFKVAAKHWINFLLPLRSQRIPDVQSVSIKSCELPNLAKPGTNIQPANRVDSIYKSRSFGCPSIIGASFDDFFDLDLHPAAAEGKLRVLAVERTVPVPICV